MPELPEIETIKRGLQKSIIGKKIVDVQVLREKNFKGDKKKVIGKYVVGIKRRAKYLIIGLNKRRLKSANTNSLAAAKFISRCDLFLIAHMKMTGQLIVNGQWSMVNSQKDKKSPYDIDKLPNKYTRVIIEFKDGTRLFFNNLRAFGWIKIALRSRLEALCSRLGPEPLSEDFTTGYLKKQFSKTRRAVKKVLMDQKVIAGIGNIYANEVLFCAGIDPRRRGKDVEKSDIKKLKKCIIDILKKAIDEKGSTASDDAFRGPGGERGKMQDYLKVYASEGEKCPKCGGEIKKIKIGGRGTFFCPKCQD